MIGIWYAGGGDTRLFSRAPKSLAAATPWRRRRRHKKTAPRISATPRRPPITPPRMTPLLLREAVGTGVATALGGELASVDTGVDDGVDDGVAVLSVVTVFEVTVVLEDEGEVEDNGGWGGVAAEVQSSADKHGVPKPQSGGHTAVLQRPGRQLSSLIWLVWLVWALAKGIDDVQRIPQSAAEKNEVGRIFKQRLYRYRRAPKAL